MVRNDFIVDLNGMIYIYNKKKWVEISREFIKSLIYESIGDFYFKIKFVNEIISLFLARIQSKLFIEWNSLDNHLIPVKNGVFDLKNKCLLSHSKDYYLLTYVDCNYKGQKDALQWHICKTQWFTKNSKDDDRLFREMVKKEDILQEFCGYCIMPKALYKKALIIYGPPDTGKSVFAAGLRNVIGIQNICSIQVDKMGDDKALATIKGKLINLLTDLPKDAMLSDGGFKALVSGGDPIQINEKFKPEQVIIPTCKQLFICNNLPKISDTTDAVFNRLIFLEFKNQIKKDDQNPEVLQNVLKEKEGILHWMIEGAIRLYNKNGHFTHSNDVRDSVLEYKYSENPINEFLDEHFTKDSEAFYPISDARDLFRIHSGNSHVSSKYISGLLKGAGIEVSREWVNNKNISGFIGFKKQI